MTLDVSAREPVVAFRIGPHLCALSVSAAEKVVPCRQTWSVPFTNPLHYGVMPHEDALLPVMRLSDRHAWGWVAVVREPSQDRQFGLTLTQPGQVIHDYRVEQQSNDECPEELRPCALDALDSKIGRIWRLDASALWDWFSHPPRDLRLL